MRRDQYGRRRPSARRLGQLERLEDRTLLSGDLVVVNQEPGYDQYNLQEYTQSGNLITSMPLDQLTQQTEFPVGRGVTVDSAGNIDIVSGSSQPYLITYSPATGSWSPRMYSPGWSYGTNITEGTVAALGHYVYVSNQGSAGGIIRFDLNGGPTTTMAPGKSFGQIALGQNGLIYGIGDTSGYRPEIDGYDPNTGALVTTTTMPYLFNTDGEWLALAVDASGNLFVGSAGGYVAKVSPDSTVLALQQFGGGLDSAMNITIDGDGQIAIGGGKGIIYFTDESLTPGGMVGTGQWNNFVTFDHYIPATIPPHADAGGPYTVKEGGTVQLDASKTFDINQSSTTLTYLWDLNGDGVFGETGAAATRGVEVGIQPTFNADGLAGSSTQTAQLEVMDSNGLVSTVATATINVVNQAPTVTLASGDTSIPIRGTFTTTGRFSDPGINAGETYTATVDYGDGTGAQPLTLAADHTFRLSHVYASPGDYPVTVDVSDGTDTGTAGLTVSATATPSFDSLVGPTIVYGQSTTTLSGRIADGSYFPTGSVAITLAGVTEQAPINPADGTFSATFATGSLGVAGSPYPIAYSYAGGVDIAAAQDSSKSMTVTPATTTLVQLTSTSIIIGTTSTSFSGTVGSSSVEPAGQVVTVTIVGTNGPAAIGSGVVHPDGTFSVAVDTSALPAGSYTADYAFDGGANFNTSEGSGTLTVSYQVNPLYHPAKPAHGHSFSLDIQVTDVNGNNLDTPGLVVTATGLVNNQTGQTYTPTQKGKKNTGETFKNTGSSYVYNLDISGLSAGTYTLYVAIGDDPVLHALTFTVA